MTQCTKRQGILYWHKNLPEHKSLYENNYCCSWLESYILIYCDSSIMCTQHSEQAYSVVVHTSNHFSLPVAVPGVLLNFVTLTNCLPQANVLQLNKLHVMEGACTIRYLCVASTGQIRSNTCGADNLGRCSCSPSTRERIDSALI